MPRTSLARHATAIAVVLLIFFAQGPIQRLVGPTGPPLIFFVPAVTMSAWQGGGGPGLLATASGGKQMTAATTCWCDLP